MHDKVTLDGIVEFHITNVCNLTCMNCSRFSNHKFSGFQKWSEYQEIYRLWGDKVNIPHIGILGGEPLLNPDIVEWIDGLCDIWSESTIAITTNGTRLDKVKGLYDVIHRHRDRVFIDISLHSEKTKPFVLRSLENFINGELSPAADNTAVFNKMITHRYENIRGEDWPEFPLEYKELNKDIQKELLDFSLIMEDMNGVKISIGNIVDFYNVGLYKKFDNFYLENSDPQKAHNACTVKYCHVMYKGILSKCPVSALLKDFANQNHIFDNRTDIIGSDDGSISAYSTLEEISDFWNFIESDNHVVQYATCPENLKTDKTYATFK